MSNPELSARDGRSGEEHDAIGHDEDHKELKVLIDAIADQLTDADRQRTATLGEMQDRIATMGRKTQTLRDHVPEQFASAFALIESGVSELAKRLSGGAAEHSPAGAEGGVSASESSGPWDHDSAEALANLYESGAADFAPSSASHVVGAHGGRGDVDQQWLENRFAEIAKGIEQSLSEIRPDRGFSAIGDRLDQFEQQIGKMFEGVATRADLDAVHLIEAHVGEVVNHLVQTHDQLTRLNVIEGQLATITRTLADVQDGAATGLQSADRSGPGLDVEAIARTAAELTAMRFAGMTPDGKDAASELRPLIERMMSDSRHGEENTVALLDTLQQAMIRLLDRIDAIEMAQHYQEAPRPVSNDYELPVQHDEPTRQAGMFSADDYEQPSYASSVAAQVYNPDVRLESDPQPAQSYDLREAREAAQSKTEKLRQDFIAEARRAKMRLANAADDEIVITSPAETGSFTMASPEAGRKPHAGRPIRPAPGRRAKASGPSAPSPRLIILALGAFLALGGLWYTFGAKPGHIEDGQSTSVAPTNSSEAKPSLSTQGAASAEQPSPGSSPGAPSTDSAPSQSDAPHGNTSPATGQQGQLTPSGSHAPKTTLPMLGIAVDLGEPVTEESMERAERHQAMATVSGRLGTAAARESNPALVPASIVPSEAETEGLSAPNTSKTPLAEESRSGKLDLPAATVGPLSLRLAAANGDPSAEFEVGARLAEGKGTQQNYKEAAKWYSRSANRGFAQSQYRLGTFYERGLGLKADRDLAAAWYRRAADQGNIKAMHNLAVLSANQVSQSPDYTMAAQWFEQAAKHGLADSQFNLAILYENGLGVKRDLKQAFLWISLAARDKDADAMRRRDILRGKLTAAEIKAADKMIEAWQPVPINRAANDPRMAGEQWKHNPKNGITG